MTELRIKPKYLSGMFACYRSSGFHITYTASSPPFALGNWTSSYFKKERPDIFNPELFKNTSNVVNELLYVISDTILANITDDQFLKDKEADNVQIFIV
jgi:hypothetical protein